MTKRPSTNVAASIHAHLLRVAKENHREFQAVLIYFAIERFLYRLTISPHAQQFILKGALLFMIWEHRLPRPTKDIDVLGFVDPDGDQLATVVQSICTQEADDDGLVFDAGSVRVRVIRDQQEYGGLRATMSSPFHSGTSFEAGRSPER